MVQILTRNNDFCSYQRLICFVPQLSKLFGNLKANPQNSCKKQVEKQTEATTAVAINFQFIFSHYPAKKM